MNVIDFSAVDVIFGPQTRQALDLLDAGRSREEILTETQSVLGVAGADLQVREGEICVLMGLSGSGKSSLLRCVNGLNTVSRGSLRVRHNGEMVDVANCDAKTLRDLRMNRIGMVFQQFGLLPWRTVRDNVGLGLELKGLSRAEIRKVVDEKLALVHLEEWAEKRISELSGGMQQRVGLARAFATDGDILLMDEPFSALDPLIRDHLQTELLELQRTLKKTILFVSHDLDEALRLGNTIVIMDGGHIVQQGTAAEIVFNPANDYVRQFVANMNPLQVLEAEDLMTPLASLEREGDAAIAGERLRVTLDADGKIAALTADGTPLATLPLAERKPGQAMAGLVVLADTSANMRPLIRARRAGDHPVLVVDADGRMVGRIDDTELYDGMLGRD